MTTQMRGGVDGRPAEADGDAGRAVEMGGADEAAVATAAVGVRGADEGAAAAAGVGVTSAAAAYAPSRGPLRSPRSLLGQAVTALLIGGMVAAGGYVVAADDPATEALGPGVVTVEVRIDHSRFDIESLRVHEGTLVRFVVHNDDPIDHELVVGDAEVHRRHASGDERRHPPVPGEVSIAPGETAMTFYEFTEPGDVVFACHLPGHVEYGMQGTIEVLPTQRL